MNDSQIKREALLPGGERGSSRDKKQRHTASARHCLAVTVICFLVAALATFFQLLALINLVYCQGEDLHFIYISVWTLLGIGSLIALLGVALNQAVGFTQLDHPAYNIAMGTPVLVVSGLGHLCFTGMRMIWQRRKDRKSGVISEM